MNVSNALPPDLQQLIAARMATGRYSSEEELLREALASLEDADADVQAVKDALADLDAGDRGLPVDEAFASILRMTSGGGDA